MKELLFHRSSLTLFVLGSATALSWIVSEASKVETGAISFTAVAILMVVTFIKVKVVMLNFMEVNHAPLLLKSACNAWLFTSLAIILGMYWLTLSGNMIFIS
ncbi:cytochrome C oxidase subunit IV family protein [Zhongshania marina]|uniref:Cytochrome C oxidase subunit IV n=1 Tax=Zhongshania marina TaxID=2304603 RepID=A0ABX9W5U8_9GAMM|nr:hypothetical protein D0911_04485 [Zhongshania marina]